MPFVLDVSETPVIIRGTMEEHTPTATERLINWVCGWWRGQESDAPVLLPLTPKYDPDRHGVYFDVIEAALAEKKEPVRNIALTGSYGVGKSSILGEVARRHDDKVISVSLSTLGFPDDEPLPAGDVAKAASTKTNRIQKEIVKQLLYSQDPLKTPGSRYRRTTRFRLGRTLWLSALLAVPIVLVFFLTGWTDAIASLAPLGTHLPWLRHAVLFAGSTLLVLCFLAVFHNRFQIAKLGAGAATIELSAKSATYFDEYLDEIVYFFEVVKRDIVIFEDIDRFDDAHIFETLRSLNSILNGAKQLKGRRVRFIYAIKDSIFDELGARAAKEELADDDPDANDIAADDEQDDAAEAEVARANRTKFFDLVIPVVPFITHRSARDLLVRTMKQDLQHGVSDELIDLTARFVADMRLIKNIRNEFAIFKRQVIDAGTLDLQEDHLFAMVLYKSTHLSDFELIKLGKSKLDQLYKKSRELVAENLKRINGELATARTQRRRLSPLTSQRAKTLGAGFDEMVTRTLRHLRNGSSIQSRTIAGVAFDEDEVTTPEFWEKVAAMADTATVRILYYDNQVGQRSMEFTREDIETGLGERIDAAEWVAAEKARLDKIIAEKTTDREFLTRADMSGLYTRPEFKLKDGNEECSFESLAKKYLGSELARRLVEAGFIDRSFTLYTSTFYTDRVSANAMNYILKNVDPHVVDMHFRLKAGDVKAIIRERGRALLREDAAYNVSILDYLLKRDAEGRDVMISRLAQGRERDRELIDTYLSSGKYLDAFVRALAQRWTDTLTFLVSEAGVDDDARRDAVDTTLQATNVDVELNVDNEFRAYLESEYGSLTVFTSEDMTVGVASRVAELLHRAGCQLASLEPLASPMLGAVVATGDYSITKANLLLALGDPEHSLSLDAIKATSEHVYERVLTEISTYLAVLDEGRATVLDETAFIAVLDDVVEADEDAVLEVVKRSVAGCVVDNLEEVSNQAWAALAEYGRFPTTFANVNIYVNELGLDDRLARILEDAGQVDTPDDANEQSKIEVGMTILGEKERLPSPKLRAELVGSIGLVDYVDAASVPVEPGNLVGWLIVEDVVEDNAATFGAIQAGDLDGRAFAISRSKRFLEFMTPSEVTPAEVGQLVNHAQVPADVKAAIIDRFTEFTVGTSRAGLTLIARYALEQGLGLTFEEITRLGRDGVDAGLVLSLLQPHLTSTGSAELAPVLVSLGGEYARLSVPNGKHPRITNTPANRALVNRLKQLGIANSDTEIGGQIKVNMKQA